MMGFKIGERLIGPGSPVYVVAELSANHNQDFDQAVRIIQAAKDSGADAVKIADLHGRDDHHPLRSRGVSHRRRARSGMAAPFRTLQRSLYALGVAA